MGSVYKAVKSYRFLHCKKKKKKKKKQMNIDDEEIFDVGVQWTCSNVSMFHSY